MKIELNNIFPEYSLIDCGSGKKIESFNDIILIRPEISAKDKPGLYYSEWKNIANAEFIETSKNTGYWEVYKKIPEKWQIEFSESKAKLKLELKLTSSKHIGIFPEQVLNWKFFFENRNELFGNKILNLFAYTGSTSIWAANFAKNVTHVDSVKKIVDWAKINSELSNVLNVRFIVDDAMKFVAKEVKRGNKYSVVILDPPPIGLGVKNEKWILSQMLEDLLKNINLILEDKSFIIMNLYSHGLEYNKIKKMLLDVFPDFDILFFEKVFGLSKTGNCIDNGYFVRLERNYSL